MRNAVELRKALCETWIGLAIGNFAYQAFTSQDWSVAFDRSFFQAVAVLVSGAVLTYRFTGTS